MNEKTKNRLLKKVIKQEEEIFEREKSTVELIEDLWLSNIEPDEWEYLALENLNRNVEIDKYYKLYDLIDDFLEIDSNYLERRIINKLKSWGYISIYKDENDEKYNNTMILKKPYLDWFLTPNCVTPDSIDFRYEIIINREIYNKVYEFALELECKEMDKLMKEY